MVGIRCCATRLTQIELRKQRAHRQWTFFVEQALAIAPTVRLTGQSGVVVEHLDQLVQEWINWRNKSVEIQIYVDVWPRFVRDFLNILILILGLILILLDLIKKMG